MWSSQIVILLINSSISISGDFCLTPLVRYFITSSREISCSSLLRSWVVILISTTATAIGGQKRQNFVRVQLRYFALTKQLFFIIIRS